MSYEKPYTKFVAKKGKTYWWCACGKSDKFPFCDGTHKQDPEAPKPVAYEATKTGDVYFCGCGKTENVPICDGSHKTF